MILKKNIFKTHPGIKEIKDEMYTKGALYASMSGSGSSVYGLFEAIPDTRDFSTEYIVYGEWLE